jgi:hypothetical protein
LKNILETKIHKEKLQTLYAFEQLIMNTEDGQQDESSILNSTSGQIESDEERQRKELVKIRQ